MSAESDASDVRADVEAFAANHPDAGVMDVLGQLTLAPKHRPLVADVLGEETADADADAPEGGEQGDDEPTDSPDTARESTAEADNRDANPTPDGAETGSSGGVSTSGGPWTALDYSTTESGVYCDAQTERAQWMGRVEKQPFSPWADRDAPAPCSKDGHTAADECGCDARFKWSFEGNHADVETVAMAEADHRLDGRVFIQRDDDPLAYVDGDDVRDPETGEVHPSFTALLDHLGLTYGDVSQSGSGVHAVYRGELPEGVKEAAWPLDDEPFGANDDLPSVEIYARKRVYVATGEHVPETPTDAREWDSGMLRTVLDLNDQIPATVTDPEEARDTFDGDDYDPDATGSDETTDDIRDLFAALDRLDPKRVADRTIVHRWNDDASTSDGTRAFHPVWSPNNSGTANVVNDKVWYHSGGGGYGGPVVMALVDAGKMNPQNADPADTRNSELWWRGVEHLRELGFEIPELEAADDHIGDEHAAVLPNSPRAQAAANGWAWRNADRGKDALTQQDAQDRTREAIGDAYQSGGDVLLEALPTLGKSYGAIAAVADTDEPISILTGRGNEEQYEQFREWCEEHGLKAKVCPSVKRDCETFNEEHGEEIAHRVEQWYDRGATGKEIHRDAEYELGEPLPCEGRAGARCSYKAGWQFDPEEYDVLIGHYLHANVQSVTSGRTVVLDESPDGAFETVLGGSRLAGAVTLYLQQTSALPFEDHTDLLENRGDPERRAKALAHFEDHDPERDGTQAFATNGHALAPVATYTILAGAGDGDAGRDLGNGWERATLPEEYGHVGLFDRETGNVHLLTPPNLQYARSVVGLDGTPTPRMWELALGTRLKHRRILDADERREYVRDALGLHIIRTTDAVKPYSGTPEHVAVGQDRTLLEAIADKHDKQPALLTTRTAEQQAYSSGEEPVLDAVQEHAHYGNLKGSNKYASTRLGAVIGSRHFGDRFIQKWGAFAGEHVPGGEDARPDAAKGSALSYGGFGDHILRHMRENETLQAAMRFGRDGRGATVYVHTNTLPDWVPLAGEPPESGNCVIRTRSDGERAVIDAAKDLADADREGWTTADVAEHPAVEVSERQARTHLRRLAERGYLSVRAHPDDGRRKQWRDERIGDAGEYGEAELTAAATDAPETSDGRVSETEEDAEGPRTVYYTWDFRNLGRNEGHGMEASEAGGRPGEVRADGGDPPPG